MVSEKLRLQAVIVCIDYDDYLARTLPLNKHHFDAVHVVTAERDTATQKLCADHGIGPVITSRMYEDGAELNKGKAINAGLDKCEDGWILLTDADTVLAPSFALHDGELDTEFLYGCARWCCPSLEAWKAFEERSCDRWLEILQGDVSNLPGWHKQNDSPMDRPGRAGYFQLFHTSASSLGRKPWYPEEFGHAGRSDTKFMRKFAAKCLKWAIPVIELNERPEPYKWQDKRGHGPNWSGRTTRRLEG